MSGFRELDWQAMIRLAAGDDGALDELMQRWREPLVRYLMRMLGENTAAEDLAAEVFVQVYRQRHRYQPRSAFSTWMFAIAHRLACNHLRWRRRHPNVPLDNPDPDSGNIGDTLAAKDASPDAALLKQESVAAVRQAIGALPEDLRTALVLFEYENLSMKEIAEVLGCTAKAVENRLYRARHELRGHLTPYLRGR